MIAYLAAALWVGHGCLRAPAGIQDGVYACNSSCGPFETFSGPLRRVQKPAQLLEPESLYKVQRCPAIGHHGNRGRGERTQQGALQTGSRKTASVGRLARGAAAGAQPPAGPRTTCSVSMGFGPRRPAPQCRNISTSHRTAGGTRQRGPNSDAVAGQAAAAPDNLPDAEPRIHLRAECQVGRQLRGGGGANAVWARGLVARERWRWECSLQGEA